MTGNSYRVSEALYAVSTDSINSHENNTDELHCGKTLIWTLKKFYPWSKVYDVLRSDHHISCVLPAVHVTLFDDASMLVHGE